MTYSATLSIPQPCHESWAAMTPTAQGRHCAACIKPVVDFTTMSDPEILTYLQQGSGSACGRFTAGQLGRPLQPLALAPSRRWQAWAAALATVLGLRELLATDVKAQQVPIEQGARRAIDARHHKEQVLAREKINVIRGQVRDSITDEGLPGVSVVIPGSTIGTATKADGTFELPLPEAYAAQEVVELHFRYIGYATEPRVVPLTAGAQMLQVLLAVDTRELMGEVVMIGAFEYRAMPPAPWRPRAFYSWGKYWLTRPFRR